jgi:hypothetical protein
LLGRTRRLFLDGLERARDSDFDEFRRTMANDWYFFETGLRTPTNGVRVQLPTKR